MTKEKNINKEKFVSLKHLKFAMIANRLNFNPNKIVKIPKYKMESDHYLNIFERKGRLTLSKIKYVKVTVPEVFLENIDLKKYSVDGKKIKKVKPELNYMVVNATKRVGLLIPFKLYEIMICDTFTDPSIYSPNDIASVLERAIYPGEIRLLDKNKKTIAVAFSYLEKF